jgi:hypothetical protein
MKRLVAFFFLTFLIAWVFWVPMALNSRGLFPLAIPLFLGQSIGAYAPLMAAGIVGNRSRGPSLKEIFRTIRVDWASSRWFLLAFAIPILVIIGANVAYNLSGVRSMPLIRSEVWKDLGPALVVILPIQFIAAFLGSPVGEEPGWRGFALPLLCTKVLGTIWGVWHFPLLIASGEPVNLLFLLGIAGNSFIVDKLFVRSGNNLLVAMVYHQAINTATTFVVGTMDTPFAVVLLWITVLITRVLL